VTLFTALISMVGAGSGIITATTACDPQLCSADAGLLRATLLLSVIERLRLLSGHSMLVSLLKVGWLWGMAAKQ
jgi:hypothetical protein